MGESNADYSILRNFKQRRTISKPASQRPILEEVPPEELNFTPDSNEEDGSDEYDDEIPFTKKMREATKNIHKLSDHLVNAKVGLAMSNDRIWAEGLLMFYKIFQVLEQALFRLKNTNPHFKSMYQAIHDIPRSSAFLEDISFYLGPDAVANYVPPPPLADYLRHLETLEEREPLRLLAYIYHLYMGLLSGGQILKKKRELRSKLTFDFAKILQWLVSCLHQLTSPRTADTVPLMSSLESTARSRSTYGGNAVTTFELEDGVTINDLKKRIQFSINDIAQDLSKDERESLIDESVTVFSRNNEIVRSIENTGVAALKNITSSPVFVFLICLTLGSLWYFMF